MYDILRNRGAIKAVKEASLSNALDNSPHIRFIKEQFVEGCSSIKASHLYEKYNDWCIQERLKSFIQYKLRETS